MHLFAHLKGIPVFLKCLNDHLCRSCPFRHLNPIPVAYLCALFPHSAVSSLSHGCCFLPPLHAGGAHVGERSPQPHDLPRSPTHSAPPGCAQRTLQHRPDPAGGRNGRQLCGEEDKWIIKKKKWRCLSETPPPQPLRVKQIPGGGLK